MLLDAYASAVDTLSQEPVGLTKTLCTVINTRQRCDGCLWPHTRQVMVCKYDSALCSSHVSLAISLLLLHELLSDVHVV
jgi:hypothetical protein